MSKITISREENLPFIDTDWVLMQMIRKKIYVSITWDEWETEEQVREKLDSVFNSEFDKALSSDSIYQKQKKQLVFLLDKFKQSVSKEEYKKTILELKNM